MGWLEKGEPGTSLERRQDRRHGASPEQGTWVSPHFQQSNRKRSKKQSFPNMFNSHVFESLGMSTYCQDEVSGTEITIPSEITKNSQSLYKKKKSAVVSRLPELGSRAGSLGSPRQLRCTAQSTEHQIAAWRENSRDCRGPVGIVSAVGMGTYL